MKLEVTPAYRQYLLKLNNITQKQIAENLGVAEMSVSMEINDRYKSHRIRCAIARAIKLPVEKAFPGYYGRPPQRSTSKKADATI